MKRKQIFIRITSVLCAAALGIGAVCYAAVAAFSVQSKTAVRLGYGGAQYVSYNGTYDGKKDLMQSIQFAPSEGLVPTLITNGTNTSLSTVSSLISGYKPASGELLGAVNGGFFVKSSGNAEGLQIQNGRLLSTNQYAKDNGSPKFYTVAFQKDGTFNYGIPNFAINAKCGGTSFDIKALNQQPNNTYGLWMLNTDYGSYAGWSTTYSNNYEVLKFKKTAGECAVNGSVNGSYVSSSVYAASQAQSCKLENGYFYILGAKSIIKPLKDAAGSYKTLTVNFAEKSGIFKNAYTALRGGDLLLKDGALQYSLDNSIKSTYTARTVVAVKKDGTVGLFVIDSAGSKLSGYGMGLPLVNTAQTLKNLGYVTAVNLDGGGSSTIVTKSGGSYVVNNHPSDSTGQRKVGNGLALVSLSGPATLLSSFESNTFAVSRVNCEGSFSIYRNGGKEYAGTACGKAEITSFASKGEFDILFSAAKALPASARTLYIRADGQGTGLSLSGYFKLKDGSEVRGPSVRLTSKGYADYSLPVVDNTDKLLGLIVTKGSSSKGTIYLDDLRYYPYVKNSDDLAPVITTKLSSTTAKKGTALSLTAKDNTWGDGVDATSSVIMLNNTPVGTGSYTFAAAPKQILSKVTFEAADNSGNRTRSYALVHLDSYKQDAYFNDVKKGTWAADAINYCYLRKILQGSQGPRYRFFYGASNMTRAEFCATAVRLKELDISKYKSVKLPYADLKSIPAWAVDYVKAAYATGMMTGSTSGGKTYFYPNNGITRAEACVAVKDLLPSLAGFKKSGNFADQGSIPSWATEAVEKSAAFGVFVGDNTGKFRPSAKITRNEIATIAMRLYAH